MPEPAVLVEPGQNGAVPRQLPGSAALTQGDKIFRGIAGAGAASVLVILGLVLAFLVVEAWPALDVAGWDFLSAFEWLPESDPPLFGVASLAYGTLVIALIAVVLAVPVAIGSALFVNEYAPRRLARPLVTLLDLLAAVPSLVYGMWGLYFLMPRLNGVSYFLADRFAFIPFFKVDRAVFGSSMFVVGIVLALMILPIIASVSREVLSTVPRDRCEAALALGGSRWGMIRTVVLPHGSRGIIGAAMLGLGRALGETIAVTLILSINFQVTPNILEPGGGSIAALIANNFPEASGIQVNALVAAGLFLFLVTLVVNVTANMVVKRSYKEALS